MGSGVAEPLSGQLYPEGPQSLVKSLQPPRPPPHSSAPHARDTFPTMQEIPKLRASSALSRTPSPWFFFFFFQKSLGETRMVIKCGLQRKLEGKKNMANVHCRSYL